MYFANEISKPQENVSITKQNTTFLCMQKCTYFIHTRKFMQSKIHSRTERYLLFKLKKKLFVDKRMLQANCKSTSHKTCLCFAQHTNTFFNINVCTMHTNI